MLQRRTLCSIFEIDWVFKFYRIIKIKNICLWLYYQRKSVSMYSCYTKIGDVSLNVLVFVWFINTDRHNLLEWAGRAVITVIYTFLVVVIVNYFWIGVYL